MLYAAESRRRKTKRQYQQASKRSINTPTPRPGSARPGSASLLINARPSTANNFRKSIRPTTPYKSKDGDRIKDLEAMFLLTESELYDFYRAFCFMAKKKVPTPLKQPRKSDKKKSKKKKKPISIDDDNDGIEPPSPSGMTVVLDSLPRINPNRPWEDTKCKVTLSLYEFFSTFHLENGGFYDAIFELVGAKNFHAMVFSEFLDGILTYGFFTNDDMIRFVFFILDKDKEGTVPRTQLLRLLDSLHHKNTLMHQQVICPPSEESSKIDYEAVHKIFMDFPYMLEPAFRLQTSIRRRIMGEKFWKKKEVQIATIDKMREQKRQGEERRLVRERNGKIRSEVGWVNYYFRKQNIVAVASQFPDPIVSLTDTGELKVEWKYHLDNDEGKTFTRYSLNH